MQPMSSADGPPAPGLRLLQALLMLTIEDFFLAQLFQLNLSTSVMRSMPYCSLIFSWISWIS